MRRMKSIICEIFCGLRKQRFAWQSLDFWVYNKLLFHIDLNVTGKNIEFIIKRIKLHFHLCIKYAFIYTYWDKISIVTMASVRQ